MKRFHGLGLWATAFDGDAANGGGVRALDVSNPAFGFSGARGVQRQTVTLAGSRADVGSYERFDIIELE
jgi:hypothetical protein